MQGQREQAEGLGFVRQHRDKRAGEPDRFAGEIGRAGRAAGIVPAGAVRGIDGIEHRLQALAQLVCFRHAEGDAGVADLGLGANKPLAHRRRRNEEGGSDPRGIEAENGLQHQWRVGCAVDGRMRADEEQLQPFVGKHRPSSVIGLLLRFLDCQQQRRHRGLGDVFLCRAPRPSARRATVSSQASGFCGTPASGHLARAARKASPSASSAAATSRVRADR